MTMLTEQPGVRFPAPDETTAPAPAEWRGYERDEVRLLVARPSGVEHVRFRDIGDHLSAGDLLVVNDSATEARELDATLVGRGPAVLHLAQHLVDRPGLAEWSVEIRTAPDAGWAVLDAAIGDVITAGSLRLTLIDRWPPPSVGRAGFVRDERTRVETNTAVLVSTRLRLAAPAARPTGEPAARPTGGGSSPTGEGNRLWRAEIRGDVRAALAAAGRPIAYGYLDRRYPLSAYQTVFGHRPGSAEMPSAGRPFTSELVTHLVSRGIQVAPVSLHTGVSSQEAGEAPTPEWFEVPEATARLVNATAAAGGRVVAVGTTATRALESAVGHGDGVVRAACGWTDRVVTPADPPRVVTGLITGWHDPHASHLLLVEAVAGSELTQQAYDAAVAHGYLWHEFGDSALLLP